LNSFDYPYLIWDRIFLISVLRSKIICILCLIFVLAKSRTNTEGSSTKAKYLFKKGIRKMKEMGEDIEFAVK